MGRWARADIKMPTFIDAEEKEEAPPGSFLSACNLREAYMYNRHI
jgi:hypothetical protein